MLNSVSLQVNTAGSASFGSLSGVPSDNAALAAALAANIRGFKRALYTGTASGTTTCAVIASATLRPMTEGNEYMTITYTPTNAASRLRVKVNFVGGSSSAGWGGLLLARSGDTNARAQCQNDGPTAMTSVNGVYNHELVLDEVAGTTSPITYNVRFGTNLAGTFYMNRSAAGAFPVGQNSFIEITEYAP